MINDNRSEPPPLQRPGDVWSAWLLVEDYIRRPRPVTAVVRQSGAVVLITPPGGGFGLYSLHAVDQFCHLMSTARDRAREVLRHDTR